ncbi:MAG: hypothetical protein WBN75_21195 [Verrucomicrobiia bacterium]
MFSADMLAENQALLLQFMQKTNVTTGGIFSNWRSGFVHFLNKMKKTFWLGFPIEFNPRMTHPFP